MPERVRRYRIEDLSAALDRLKVRSGENFVVMTTDEYEVLSRRPERPVARRSDPQTSHEAAASVKDLPARQKVVMDLLRERPDTDQGLARRYAARRLQMPGRVPEQSPSGLRTRRSELVRKGLVIEGEERLPTSGGRMAIVWEPR